MMMVVVVVMVVVMMMMMTMMMTFCDDNDDDSEAMTTYLHVYYELFTSWVRYLYAAIATCRGMLTICTTHS